MRLGQTTFRPFGKVTGAYVGADAGGTRSCSISKVCGDSLTAIVYDTALVSGEVPAAVIKDRVVLIGVNTESVKDFFVRPTAGACGARRFRGGCAQIVSQYLKRALEGNRQVRTTTDSQEIGWILLWGIMGGALGLAVRSPWRFLMLGGSGLLILTFGAYFAFLSDWWIPSVPPAFAWLGSAALVTTYMLNQEKRAGAPNAIILAACFDGSCRGNLARAGSIYGRRPSRSQKFT